MTIRQKFEQMLYERGLFAEQATAIMDKVVELPENEVMRDPVDDYPPALVNVGWMSVKRAARDYIDETCPRAWFRPLFETVNE
jgi:hypothetical protein